MTDKDKIRLADVILEYIQNFKENVKENPKMIGTLNTAQGINGFKKSEIGVPVFDVGDKYMIVMENVEGTKSLEIKFYKETLKPYINYE